MIIFLSSKDLVYLLKIYLYKYTLEMKQIKREIFTSEQYTHT